MVNSKRLKRYFRNATKEKRILFSAVTGNLSGVVRTDRENYIYVIDKKGHEIIVYNNIAPLAVGIHVKIGTLGDSNILQVVEVRDSYSDKPLNALPNHRHEWDSVNPTWIWQEQFLLGLSVPVKEAGVGVTKIKVSSFPFTLNGEWRFFIEQIVDITSEIPTDGAMALLVQCDENGVCDFKVGDDKGSRFNVSILDLPVPDNDKFPVVGLKVYKGQTEFLKTPNDNDFIDLRFTGYSNGGNADFVTWDGVLDKPFWVTEIESGALFEPPIMIERWSALEGEDTFEFTDFVGEILSVEVQGLGQDPLTYTLDATGENLVLDTPLVSDAVVTAQYKVMII